MKKRNNLNINPFVLIFFVVIVCGISTFLITPGILENGIYTELPRNKVNFNSIFNFFRAIPMGLKDTSNLVILILVIGAAMNVYKKTGALDAGITHMIGRFGANSRTTLLVIMIIIFSVMGGFLGWIEVLLPFTPLFVAMVLALGYDTLTAVAAIIIGSMGGFMAGPTNLYTVGVCNGILQKAGIIPADGDLFVGLNFRIVLWIVVTLISVLYILRYAIRVRKNPASSYVAHIDVSDLRQQDTAIETKFTIRHGLVLGSILVAMIMTIIGMKIGFDGVKWTIDDVSAIFFASALFSGIVGRMSASEISDAILEGAKSAVAAAMIVGVARAVFWIMNVANINATIVYHATQLLEGLSPTVTAIGIVILVSFLNGLIPSGSGKGALLCPIIVPIALPLGLTDQTAVLAYQFGDGITNMFWFSYGTLLLFLSYGKVPLQAWYKFFTPLMGIFFVLSAVTLGIAVSIGF